MSNVEKFIKQHPEYRKILKKIISWELENEKDMIEQNKIEYCSLTGCSGYFEEGQDIYCVEGEHFCDEECLHEYYVPEEAREAIVEE